MKYLAMALLFSASAFAGPVAVITGKDVHNGYATVAGRLQEKPAKAVGISVMNGGLWSSTITDSFGRWSIVFRVLSNTVGAGAWDLDAPPTERNEIQVTATLPYKKD